MPVNLIAAVGNQFQIGINGRLPWYMPADLKWFKELTMGGVVVVGYTTSLTLPLLPGREVYVMQREDTPEAIKEKFSNREIWIAGGAKTYERWIPFVERFYISRIDYDGPADTYMPFIQLGKQ